MMKLALKIEKSERVRKECGLSNVYGSKFQYNLPKAKEGTETKAVVATASGNIPMRTVTLRGVTAADNQREGPSKHLTDVKFQARREKGLCFKCGEKYHAGHRCKIKENKELRILVVRENGEEFEIIEEDGEEEVADENVIEVGAVENLNIELSFNSVVGLTNSGTMKVKGKVKDEQVVMLIDCGATHNFKSEKLVTGLNLPLKATTNYGVILGLGAAIKGKGICGKVEVLLDNWKVVDSFFGLTNAPSTFQALMNVVFRPYM
ncbi:ty3-gypsy retrotransposon protein [Cucumis melo var. makuwa]|uniref:Ty3-gypsy retrotransposon protein n=1 Tax=Cucumis melo var. makuwa TaxID=1194695 RepID=A0A5A7URC0_CUCMM|nr:ty3-gypsy retrotransposon protein [Cucumis melo var. makuwa]TYK29909.1 ty3-gypsy retrotransposon protein [Cucumis melo var. makuwa]